ncbi:MAG: helix-turn-helix domain-containing protein [Stellaceae bacterium]
MAQDRLDGDRLALTHEFIALMLGVHCPGVTVALSLLQRRGLIQTTRGGIVVVDRGELICAANGAYVAP